MSDLIDRQAAINALINLWADKPFGNPALTEIKECVERVPSAQPEKSTEKRTETHARDLISRQAAIDAARELFTKNATTAIRAMYEIERLPSIQPEIIRCKDCLMHGVCRFEQYLGLDGYCSKAERRTDGRSDQQTGGD